MFVTLKFVATPREVLFAHIDALKRRENFRTY